jgi:23S rRNA (pseudouridine1915-N3)-methyltransferase
VIWKILAIGKPKLPFIAAGVEEYAKRISRFTRLELIYLPQNTPDGASTELLKRSEGSFRIVLDEHGTQRTSRQFADLIQKWEINSVRQVSVIIGGAEGHGLEIRQNADLLFSLSQMTLQHEAALLIVLEQIYRAHTINAGLPYHR